MKEMLHSPGCFSYSSLIVSPSSFDSSLSFFLLFLSVCFIVACVIVAAMSRHQKSASRPLQLEGRVAMVVQALEPEGAVLVGGELWRARSLNGDRIERGRVRIVGARGHWLEVEAVA
jgi:membrane protein implicated in regulation of membrane protease activity